MSGVSFVSLLTPGGALEVIWRVNPQARAAFAAMGPGSLVLMGAVCIACVLAAVGLWRRLERARLLAIAILSVNMVGDLDAAVVRGDPRTLVGLPIAALLIAYLMGSTVRRWFAGESMPSREHQQR